jgi:hypothetical protein
VLWAPGSHALLDFLWRDLHGVSAVVRGAAWVLVAGALVGLVPMTALTVALADPDHVTKVGYARRMEAGWRALPAMTLLLVVATVAQASALGAGVFVGELAEGWTQTGLGEAHAQELGAALGLPFLALATAIGVTHDLACAAVVCRAIGGMRALVVAATEFFAAPVSLGWSWAWRAMASLALVVAVGKVADRLGGLGGLALLVLALLHQMVVLGRVALRASWLAAALRRLAPDRTL